MEIKTEMKRQTLNAEWLGGGVVRESPNDEGGRWWWPFVNRR